MIKEIKEYVIDTKGITDLVLPINSQMLSLTAKDRKIILSVLSDKEYKSKAVYRFQGFIKDDEVNLEEGAYTYLDSVEIGFAKIMFHLFYRKPDIVMSIKPH